MGKTLYLTIYLLISLSISVVAQDYILRDEAYKVLKRNNLVDTLKDNVQVSKQIVPLKTKLKFMEISIESPEWNSWFFLIDKDPFADWQHPCKYVFVNVIDTSLTIIDGKRGASFATDILLWQKIPDELKLPAPVFNNVPASKKKVIAN